MGTMRIAVRVVLLLLPASALQAQTSGCVRDPTGALQCALQPSRTPGGATAFRPISRPDLSRDALRRSDALIERRREAIEQQRRQVDEQRAVAEKDCPDRAPADRPPGCGF